MIADQPRWRKDYERDVIVTKQAVTFEANTPCTLNSYFCKALVKPWSTTAPMY